MNDASNHRKLAAALEQMGGLYSVDDLLNRIYTGDMQSFSDGDSWVITQISVYPRKRVLNIVTAIGSLDGILGLHDRVVNFARDHKCAMVTAVGRFGWDIFVDNHGWKVNSQFYTKEI